MRRALLAGAALSIAACAGTRPPYQPPDGARAADAPNVGWHELGWTPAWDARLESKIGDGPPPPPACGPASCSGCCLPSGGCAQGLSSKECGKGGAPCVDCAAQSSSCQAGACVGCTPSCAGKTCGESNGCGGTCAAGSGCCTPACAGKQCGEADGCGGTCAAGSGCCSPACGGKHCGEADGCGGSCDYGSGCTPSCGGLLVAKGLPDAGLGCCNFGCDTTQAGGPGATWDCKYCCSSTGSSACTLPSCGALLNFKGLPDAGLGCCPNGCNTTTAGGPGATYDCKHCCSSTPGQQACL